MALFRTHSGLWAFFAGFVLAGFLTGCSYPLAEEHATNPDGYVGRLEAVRMTSYMYGSHVLVSGDGRYALEKAKGADVRLDNYTERKVRVEAERVEGYPVDGGPPLLAVKEIRVLE